MNATDARRNARMFAAMAHPVRLAMLDALAESKCCVNDLMRHVRGASQVTVSQHLRVLRDAGIVHCAPLATRRIYAPTHPAQLRAILRALTGKSDKISPEKKQKKRARAQPR
jgi:DNA-binding transcriptional ArsR family regulator